MVVFDRVVVIADQGCVRLWQFNLLGQITDGQAAWDQFISGVQQTFEKNASGVPIGCGCCRSGCAVAEFQVGQMDRGRRREEDWLA